MTHMTFVALSYGVSLLAIAGLIGAIVLRTRRARTELDRLAAERGRTS